MIFDALWFLIPLSAFLVLMFFILFRNKPKRPTRFRSPIEKLFWESWAKGPYKNKLNFIYDYKIPGTGRKFQGDFVEINNRVIIELDGYKWHSDKESFTKDRQRERIIEAQDWKLIRFSGSEVYNNPDKCVKEVWEFIVELRKNRGFLVNLITKLKGRK